MGHNDHINFELHDDIEDLVAEGLLDADSAGYGVAQQVINQGYASLSEKQGAVWDINVVPALKKRKDALEMQRRMGKSTSQSSSTRRETKPPKKSQR
jgi:hypothetical protein